MSLATHDLIRPSPLCKVLSRSPLLLLLPLTLRLCLYIFYQCVCVSRLSVLLMKKALYYVGEQHI